MARVKTDDGYIPYYDIINWNTIDTLPLTELENLAYRFQVDYTPPLTESQRERVVKILKSIYRFRKNINKDSYIENKKRSRKVTCLNEETLINQKNVFLMSDAQLFFMKDILPSGETIFYCFDRYDDVDYLLHTRINPYTRQKLTRQQLKDLADALDNSSYPLIEVGDFFDELKTYAR